MKDNGVIPFTVIVLLFVVSITKIGFISTCIVYTIFAYAIIAVWVLFFLIGVLFVGVKASWHLMNPARIINAMQGHV